MTTMNVQGRISQIVTEDPFAIVASSGGSISSPATISPAASGETTVVMASVGASGAWFQLSSSFNVGDVVEIYNDTSPQASVFVMDENGNDITASGLMNPNVPNKLSGAVYRKLRGTSGMNWGHTA